MGNAHLSKEQIRAYRQKWRLEVLVAYSGGEPRCACCGETTYEFLVIDHIDGGGLAHRRREGLVNGSQQIYLWLRRRGYPAGFRVLCHNCNMARGNYGFCPHEEPARTVRPIAKVVA